MGAKLHHYLVKHAGAVAPPNSGPLRRFFAADSDIVAASDSSRKVRFVNSYRRRLTLGPAAQQRLRLETDLHRALEKKELTLYYQPQFEVRNGFACGVEALARWFRCDGSVVEPCVFIPLAEEIQLIGALGSWVLEEACKAVHEWRLPVDRLKLDKSLVQNLSRQWKDVAIVRAIIALGKELGIAVIAEGVETEQQFQLLEQLGCQQVQGYLLARPAPKKVAYGILTRRWGMRKVAPADAICATPGRLNAS